MAPAGPRQGARPGRARRADGAHGDDGARRRGGARRDEGGAPSRAGGWPGARPADLEPFELAGARDGGSGGLDDETGVLLLHGLTATPYSVREWGEFLAAAGLTVRCPLLPGHGTRWQDLASVGWRDWYDAVDDAFEDLRRGHARVFVMGLSMGGTLVLRLAEERGAQVAGVVTVNPSLGSDRWATRLVPLAGRVVRSVRSSPRGGRLYGRYSDIKAPGVRDVGYDEVPLRAFASLRELWAVTVPDLHRIVCPVLTFRSVVDHVVEPSSGRRLL
ncbi:alpha/beta fold hydrolase, partial [Frankia sp. CNm7]